MHLKVVVLEIEKLNICLYMFCAEAWNTKAWMTMVIWELVKINNANKVPNPDKKYI